MGDASPMQEWVIGLQEVQFQRKIGAGSAGTTYAAEWRGAQVAVKVAGYSGASMDGWRAEVDALTRLRHPNIVQYLGCVISPPTYCLVLEFCDAGDLYRALRLPTPPTLMLRVARAVASGMAYLHRRHIMHRDLKSSNVLLDTAGGVKLTDFGVAVQVEGAGGNSSPSAMESSCDPLTTETGTYRWMAPEVTRHEGYTKSADVFSYAMLLFELITHEVPFADRPPLQVGRPRGAPPHPGPHRAPPPPRHAPVPPPPPLAHPCHRCHHPHDPATAPTLWTATCHCLGRAATNIEFLQLSQPCGALRTLRRCHAAMHCTALPTTRTLVPTPPRAIVWEEPQPTLNFFS